MSNARNLARLLPNASGQLPDAAMASGSVINTYSTSAGVASTANATSPGSGSTYAYADMLSLVLTPVSSNSKFILIGSSQYHVDSMSNKGGGGLNFDYAGTKISPTTVNWWNTAATFNSSNPYIAETIHGILTPNTTSQITVKLQIYAYCEAGANYSSMFRASAGGSSVFTILEVAP